jgi:endonuclease/exonuclease/phosphatase family metal-dependent hydrolase
VCLQEVYAESFELDFAFLVEAGYTGNALHRKGRMRPATFWKPDQLRLVGEPLYKDRSLVTCFERTDSKQAGAGRVLEVENAHLTAGPEGEGRRVRQVHESLTTVTKQLKKIRGATRKKKKGGEEDKEELNLVVVGDFNSEAPGPLFQYLTSQEPDSTQKTSKQRPCGPLVDV